MAESGMNGLLTAKCHVAARVNGQHGKAEIA